MRQVQKKLRGKCNTLVEETSDEKMQEQLVIKEKRYKEREFVKCSVEFVI